MQPHLGEGEEQSEVAVDAIFSLENPERGGGGRGGEEGRGGGEGRRGGKEGRKEGEGEILACKSREASFPPPPLLS